MPGLHSPLHVTVESTQAEARSQNQMKDSYVFSGKVARFFSKSLRFLLLKKKSIGSGLFLPDFLSNSATSLKSDQKPGTCLARLYVPHMHEPLGSIPGTTHKRKKMIK